MGEKLSRLRRFLIDHPACCYCGDTAETEDHCPARICFRDRIGPEAWSFPACRSCNAAISRAEQVVAFYIRVSDFTDENFRDADVQRLMSGVKNNNPEAFPDLFPSANEKREMLARLGIRRQPGELLFDEPVVKVPATVGSHMDFFNRKLAAALFYKQSGQILTTKHIVMGRWFQSQDGSANSLIKALDPAWSHKFVGQRPNLDFGDQLSIKIAAGAMPEVFSYTVQFSTSICFWGGAGVPQDEKLHSNWKPYRAIKDGI